MSIKISAVLLSDTDLAPTVRSLQKLISKRFLPDLGQSKRRKIEYDRECYPCRVLQLANCNGVLRKEYSKERTKLFILVSNKLGRGDVNPADAIQENAYIYFVRHMWGRIAPLKYFPLSSVALVAILLCAVAPAIYGGLSDCEKSGWVVLGTTMSILCDIMEALAIACTFIFTADTARKVVCEGILPLMGVAKFTAKLAKVGGQLLTVVAAGEVAGEAVLMYSRYMAVVNSQSTWEVRAVRTSAAVCDENRLSPEEELIVMGLVVDY